MSMQHPKVAVIGAGSLFFGRQAIWQMATSEHLNTGTLALVDTDPVHLQRMVTLAKKVIEHTGVDLKLEASTDAKDILPGCDFVVFSFAKDSARYRGIDCMVSEKYGIRMCSGDTIGPGGIFRTLREFPHILNYCRQVEELCPDAFVINYINPTTANGIGIRMFAPKLKSFALCDGLHMPMVKQNYAQRAGIVANKDEWTDQMDADFDFRIAGVNHFTWLLKAAYKGEDMTPVIAETLREQAAKETDGGDVGAKAAFNTSVSYEFYKAFGYVPTCTGHTKEYVRFWQGHNVADETIPQLSIWDAATRHERHADMWRQVDEFALGVSPIEKFMEITKRDHATDIIETMVGGLDKPFFINTANNGAVPNMPDDAFLELLCDVDENGPTPRPVGDGPVGLRGLWQQVLDAHQLSVEAAVSGDRDLLFRAFMCDPMVSYQADAKAIIEELLVREKAVLPDIWYK